MQSMLSYLQFHLCCDACIIMLATIIIYAPFHKCTPSYDNTSSKQTCKQKQKTSQTIISWKNSNDHVNSIIKITWIRSIQYPRVITLQHGSRRQKTIYKFQNITQNKRRRIMAQLHSRTYLPTQINSTYYSLWTLDPNPHHSILTPLHLYLTTHSCFLQVEVVHNMQNHLYSFLPIPYDSQAHTTHVV